MGMKTSLYQQHIDSGAKMVDFGGWDMPIHYGSQIDEHNAVRNDAGMFDVSHMTVVDVVGPQATDFLRYLLANDVAKLTDIGKALYSCMLNEQGGIVDDLIAYKLGKERYRIVINSGTREKDITWIQNHQQAFDVEIYAHIDLGVLAVQGPNALSKLSAVFDADLYQQITELKPFYAFERDSLFIARTGYTGENGIECILPAEEMPALWVKLLAAGITACGLGARDTLRLEAGLNLYGTDMDETTSPFESNLTWTVAINPDDRDFLGRDALKKLNTDKQLVGLVLQTKGVLRNHQKVVDDNGVEGEITSGSYSPTLQTAIALARLPKSISKTCYVEVRGNKLPAQVVKPPFVRFGKKVFE